MNRTPMKRTSWLRRLPPTEKQLLESASNPPLAPVEYARVAIKKIVKSRAVMVKTSDLPPTVIAKTKVVRNEPYRRLVAAMPCKACGIQDYSQAAHVPPDGKGIKQDDRLIFALCCTRPGVTGCHVEFDQYRMFPKAQAVLVGRAWAADTRRQIGAMGKWPKNLPQWTQE